MRAWTIAAVVLATAAVSSLVAWGGRLLVSPLAPSAASRLAPWILVWLVVQGVGLVAAFHPRAPFCGRIVGRGRPRTPAIAITFDDGPTEPYTSQILDVLKAHDARATFFVLGARAASAAPTLARAVADGHELGNHTWDHPALVLHSPRYIRDTIRRTSDVVARATGRRPRLFRAPFGWRNPWVGRAARAEGCQMVAWTTGVHDTDRPGADLIAERGIASLKDGAILLLHDGRSFDPRPDASQVVEALPRIVEEARRRGFRMLTLSEMLHESRARS